MTTVIVILILVGCSLLWLLIEYIIGRVVDKTADGISNKITQRRIDKGTGVKTESLADRFKENK